MLVRLVYCVCDRSLYKHRTAWYFLAVRSWWKYIRLWRERDVAFPEVKLTYKEWRSLFFWQCDRAAYIIAIAIRPIITLRLWKRIRLEVKQRGWVT
ncbi:MAG TPA: hypothetical protein V6D12_22715 [Candidatus Obscuribacterales bacterium]